MIVVVNNIAKKDDLDFKARVLETMKKQIRKKFFEDGLKKLQAEGVETKRYKGEILT